MGYDKGLDNGKPETPVCGSCLELVDPSTCVRNNGINYCGRLCAGTLALFPIDGSNQDGTRRVRVYFDKHLVAIGTADDFTGQYATSEVMVVTGDPIGKTYLTLRTERATEIRGMLREYRRQVDVEERLRDEAALREKRSRRLTWLVA